MISLRVYSGPETESRFACDSEDDSPAVLSIADFVTNRNRLSNRLPFEQPQLHCGDTLPISAGTPLSRAKALHHNRACRFCSHPVVDPVLLNDGMRDGSGQYVPGSATLVGFHCSKCRCEWPLGE